MKFEIKISTVWTDVSAYVLRSEGELKTENITDEVEVDVFSTLETVVPLVAGLEFRINNESTYPFAGVVTSLSKLGDNSRRLIVRSYSYQFHQAIVNEYYQQRSPEFIFEDLIGKYTDFTYASSVSSGITLDELTIKDKKLVDVLDTLITVMQYQIRVDFDKNVYLEPRGFTDTGLTFTVGSEIVKQPSWVENLDNTINKVTFIGDYQTFSKIEYFDGDGANDTFTLVYKPVNVTVSVGGTVQAPEVEGATGEGDYTVNSDERQIIFNTGSIPGAGTDNVVITYTYAIPVRIESVARQDIPIDEIRWKKIENKSIKTYADARRYIAQIFNKYAEIEPTSEELSIRNWYPGLVINSKATFVDSSIPINSELVINSISFKYPEPTVVLNVGNEQKSFTDYQAEAFKKLQELESTLSAQEIIQRYIPSIDNEMIYENRYSKVTKTSITGTTGIYDSPAFGIWDTNTYEDTSVGSFILGHPTFGQLGVSQLGDGGRQDVEVFLESSDKRFVELFYDLDFQDAGTGTWSTANENLVLLDTQDMVSEIFAKDLENIDNVYVSTTVTITGTGLDNLKFYIGEYNGVSTVFSEVSLSGPSTLRTGTLALSGDNRRGLVWKAEADGGTATLTKISINYSK